LDDIEIVYRIDMDAENDPFLMGTRSSSREAS